MISPAEIEILKEAVVYIKNAGTGFIIIETNSSLKEREALALLNSNLKMQSKLVIDFKKEKTPNLFFSRIKRRININKTAKIIYITNLYLMTANRTNAIQLARDLNFNRDLYYNSNKVFVFFFPVFFVDLIVRYARDFYDYVSATYKMANSFDDNALIYNTDFADELHTRNRATFLEEIVKKRKIIGINEKLNNLVELGLCYYKLNETINALKVFRRGYKYALLISNELIQAKLLLNIGNAYYAIAKKKLSSRYYRNALSLFEKLDDSTGVSKSLIRLTYYYVDNNNFDDALDCLQKVTKIAATISDPDSIVHVMLNLGDVYAKIKNYDKALEIYDNLLVKFTDKNDYKTIININMRIAQIYFHLNRLEESIHLLEKCISGCINRSDDANLAILYNNISQIHRHRGEYERAKYYLSESLSIIRKTRDRRGEAIALRNMANLLYSLDDLDSSITYAKMLCELDKENNSVEMSGDEKLLSFLQNAILIHKSDAKAAHKKTVSRSHSIIVDRS